MICTSTNSEIHSELFLLSIKLCLSHFQRHELTSCGTHFLVRTVDIPALDLQHVEHLYLFWNGIEIVHFISKSFLCILSFQISVNDDRHILSDNVIGISL